MTYLCAAFVCESAVLATLIAPIGSERSDAGNSCSRAMPARLSLTKRCCGPESNKGLISLARSGAGAVLEKTAGSERLVAVIGRISSAALETQAETTTSEAIFW